VAVKVAVLGAVTDDGPETVKDAKEPGAGEGELVGTGVGVGVGLEVGLGVGLDVGVDVGAGVGEGLGDGVGVGAGALMVNVVAIDEYPEAEAVKVGEPTFASI